MARFQIEEFYGERLLATTSAEAPDALSAAETLTGKAISTKALQEHWIRVVDERGRHRPRIRHCGGAAQGFCQMTSWLGAKPGSQIEVTQDYASRAWPPTPEVVSTRR
ncbi:hypothetical protein [Mesorhizobium sp. WSM3859]|uniref:hypothetical protein n=1 Tax=Mesorhizobium sp. WSM3859 TaxID=2029402 RepID=UPI001141025B|nr:hypothetical protein [Mesorhizobium sp. WSM3859]